MSLFFKQEKEVMATIQEYFAVVDEAMEVFEAALLCFLDHGNCPEFADGDHQLHRLESRADDIRRDVEKRLYKHALLPESRGDLLGLLESYDKLPNLAEVVTFILVTQQVFIPEDQRENFRQLLAINIAAYKLVREMVARLFEDPDRVGDGFALVDAKESESDAVERTIIVDVYRSELAGVQKMLLRDLTQRIGDISDSAENVAGRLEIIALKRRI